MKTLKEFIVESDAPANVTGDAVSNPDSKPIFKQTMVHNKLCLEMDEDTYDKCLGGKIPFARWSKYITDEDLRNQVRSVYNKNKSILIKNSKTGAYTNLK